MVTLRRGISQQTFLLASFRLGALEGRRYDANVPPSFAATASGVDWSHVVAVRLLGVALAVIFLWWAIRRMFGGKK